MAVPTHLAGKRVGNNRIELISLLGEGSYGAVYRGVVHRGGLRQPKHCAVKVLRADLDKHHLMCQRRELDLHQRVSDGDGIVTLYETFKEGKYQYIVMKYCPDGDLWLGINKGRYLGNDALIKDIFTQVLDATEYCHTNSVYHRDIKPENILLCNGGHKALLADFGLATGDQTSDEKRSGSPWYMSPECWGSMHTESDDTYATAPNDVWSLGVLLINLSCGRHAPWKYAHRQDQFFKDFIKQPNLLRLFVPLSPQVHDILARIFLPNPAARISIRDLKVAVKKVEYFAIPSTRRREYRNYQRAVWKATIGPSPSRPLSIRINTGVRQLSALRPVGEDVVLDNTVSPLPARLRSDVIITPSAACADCPMSPRLVTSPHSLSSTSSIDSGGPATPEMPASIPSSEVPDIADSLDDQNHRLLQTITIVPLSPIGKSPAWVDAWQGILDAISAM